MGRTTLVSRFGVVKDVLSISTEPHLMDGEVRIETSQLSRFHKSSRYYQVLVVLLYLLNVNTL